MLASILSLTKLWNPSSVYLWILICQIKPSIAAPQAAPSSTVDYYHPAPTNISNHTGNESIVQGWIDQPDGRGTIDIIWSCIFTLFLCTWVVLCLNVPSEGDTFWYIFRRKCYWMFVGVLGPEFILQMALGQYHSARESVRDFVRLGHPEWTMRHAFFADMGGFLLETAEASGPDPTFPRVPLDARKVYYLVANKHIKFSDVVIKKEDIVDKDKNDAFVRVITVIQTLWFVINTISRWIQHLAISTFELTTFASIICSLPTYFCWAHKPSNIEAPIILRTNVSLAKILLDAGDQASSPYSLSPFDFVRQEEWAWTLYWAFWMNCLKRIGVMKLLGAYDDIRPLKRIPNDYWPKLSKVQFPILVFFQMAFVGIHLVAWNFHFPTSRERLGWRISSVGMLTAVSIYWLAEIYTFRLVPALRKVVPHSKDHHLQWISETYLARKAASFGEQVRQVGSRHNLPSRVPLTAILPACLCICMYCPARGYIFAEELAGLRSLPRSAFQTVNWNLVVPHI